MNYRIFIIILTLILSACSDNTKNETDSKSSKQGDKLTPVVDRSKGSKEVTTVTDKPQFNENKDAVTENPVDYVSMTHIHDKDLVIGNRNADVTMIEYSSPTCPHCSYYHKEVLPALRKKYIDTGKMVYIFREFIANKQDLDASILGRCYKSETDPLKLFDVIYTSQENWAFNKNYREILGNIGQLAGITREKYAECLNDAVTTMFLVNNARTIAAIPGFVGTPAFFIGDKMHKGAYSVESLSKAIDEALMQKKDDPKI
jgi:protein-disulfide isomerase